MSGSITDVVAFLLADATLAGLIGNRLDPFVLEQGGALPAMTYQVVSNQRQHAFGAAVGIAFTRVQFDVYCADYDVLLAITEALRKRLDAYQGAAGTGTIEAAFFDGERDLYEPSVRQEAKGTFRRTMDYLIYLEDEA